CTPSSRSKLAMRLLRLSSSPYESDSEPILTAGAFGVTDAWRVRNSCSSISARLAGGPCPREHLVRVIELLTRRRDVENERREAGAQVAGHLRGDTVIASDEVRTEGPIVLERPEPVRVAVSSLFRT